MIDLTIMVPVIVAIVSGVKQAGMDSKYAPILSIVLGLIAFYLLGTGDLGSRLFEGVVAGLSASGLYSGVRATLNR